MKNTLLVFIGCLFFILSLVRFERTIEISIQKEGGSLVGGELVANFPMYSIMELYNLALFESVKNKQIAWFPSGVFCSTGDEECVEVPGEWFYGPFHHFVHLPLTLFVNTFASFINILLAIYILVSLSILYFFSKYYFARHNKLLTIFIFAVTLGNFAFLENLNQRNIEITEFILIFVALFAMKFKKEWLLGISLSLAFLAKALPLIFLPYLIVKKRYLSIVAYMTTFIVVIIVTEFTLGWSNWVLIKPQFADQYGIFDSQVLLGERPLAVISHVRGSFYTFILSFFSDVHLTRTTSIVTYKEELFGVINYGFFAFCSLISFVSFRRIYFNNSDYFFDFALILSLMLLIFPRINPHYYIFSLYAVYYILHTFLGNHRQDIREMKIKFKFIFVFLFVMALFMLGEFIPFSIIDRAINQNYPYFHFFAAYGISGFGTFILWALLIIVGPEDNVRLNFPEK